MASNKDSTDSLIIRPGQGVGAGTDILEALLNHFSDGAARISDVDPAIIKELREELERGPFFSEDMKHLWLMLEKVLTKTGRSPGIDQQIRLLNLACGHCEEGAVLSAFFGKIRPKSSAICDGSS